MQDLKVNGAMKSNLVSVKLNKGVMAVRTAIVFGALMWPLMGYAEVASIPDNHHDIPSQGDLIGQDYQVVANKEDTLVDIARTHNVGYEEIRSANPDVSIWVPGEGTVVTIPRRHILPKVARTGIVINVAELRLYYYPAVGEGVTPWVETYPIGIGREGYNTPLGITKTTIRLENPAWYPPQSMRQEAAERGDPAPAVVPPGPDNPLGDHAILLDIPGYLIHGTNQPDGIGMRASRGCIRMYPEDIGSIFDNIPSGTQVNIIDQPVKVGADEEGTSYLQVFRTFDDESGIQTLKEMLLSQSLVAVDTLAALDEERLSELFEQPDDQIKSLSLFYQTSSESDDESMEMEIYQMISQVADNSC
jgi:L,D-transpeptidase ErfK/SrfK